MNLWINSCKCTCEHLTTSTDMLVEEQEEINTYLILLLLHSSLINHNQSTSTLYLIFGHLGTTLINSFWDIF